MKRDFGYIGIDQGTTNLKAGLYGMDGELYVESVRSFAIDRHANGKAEQDPLYWNQALREVLRELIESEPQIRIQGIGVCTQVSSHIFVDADGMPLTNVILWQDQRTVDFVSGLNEQITKIADEFPAGFGADATSTLARAKWAQQQMPDLWENTKYILNPKDYINFRLTGIFASDPLSTYDSVDEKGRYIDALDKIVPGVLKRLPDLHDFREPLGNYKKTGDALLDSALQHAVVAVGTMDVFGNLFGSGASKSGDVIEVCGTCEILGALSMKANPTKGVVSFPKIDDLHFHAGPTKSGGASTQWFAKIMAMSIEEMVQCAEKAEAGCKGLVFLPYLEGERAPLWDTDARGVFFGISGEHSTEHFCRAVLEGVAFSARHLLEEIEKAAGYTAKNVRISGGGSKSDLNCQIRADILNKEIERIHVTNSGMIGAVAFAAVASGNASDVAEAVRTLVHVEKTFMPDADNRARYDALYGIYRSLYTSLSNEYTQLAEYRLKLTAGN